MDSKTRMIGLPGQEKVWWYFCHFDTIHECDGPTDTGRLLTTAL